MNDRLLKPSQISVNDWQKFKAARIRAIKDSPQAFGDTLEKAMSRSDTYWIELVEKSEVFVISSEGHYIATVILKQDDDGVWSIKSLWTDPEYRNRGLATTLLTVVLQTAKESGIEVIELGINANQTTAIKLYESLGFQTIKSIPGTLMGDGSRGDLFVMRLAIK